ncbi:LAME_0E08812g1_1 [Lachancea meyersii CBS 8951]|uniref:Origin recognition complex subunit 1 n=1 Tax=Lachancea meyersii CBS 8951 TaxID=1266667 RepID=A0A1G4JJW6_9SACH|nr:LAME_0E08812g1_1 [Lachancea meyersii CBS 8951]
MASTQQEFEGWDIIRRDENGSIIDNDLLTRRVRRRGGKSGEKEFISLKRLKDSIEIGCGDSIVMQDPETDSFSVYMVHEIRLNTLNHLVEIWAFTYLRRNELDEREYIDAWGFKGLPAGTDLDDMTEAQLVDTFEELCDPDELCLTAELTELYLADFFSKAEVCDTEKFTQKSSKESKGSKTSNASDDEAPDMFLVRFACEPDGVSFNKIDIQRVEHNVGNWDARASHNYVKELTIDSTHTKARKRTTTTRKSREGSKSSSTSPKSSPKKKKGGFKTKIADEPLSEEELDDFQDATEDPVSLKEHKRQLFLTESPLSSDSSLASDSGDEETPQLKGRQEAVHEKQEVVHEEPEVVEDDEQEEIEQNEKQEASNENDEDVVMEDSDEEMESEDEEEVDEKDGISDDSSEASNSTSRRTSRSPRKKTRSLRSAASLSPTKKPSKSNGSALAGIKKYTKKNVSRAKKAYTPFSKRFKRPQDIPDLTKIAQFNQDQIDLDVAAIENRLRSPKKQHTTETIFSKVKKQLYTSHGKDEIMKAGNFDDYLPARENEFASIYLSLYSAIEAGTGTTVYVAGTPGVGKTLTVREVVKELLQSVEQNELPNFQYAEINGLKMIKPSDSYEVLWNKISGERLTSGAAMESLEFYFNKVPKNKKRPILVLLDELDALVTKSQDVMYNFFNWTTYSNAKLIVVAVANTMDLPERQLGNKVSSRIGFTRIMFTGYTHEELKIIINLRLKGLNESYFYVNVKNGSAHIVFDGDGKPDIDTTGMRKVKLKIAPDAIEIASRKIASVSGDARRALKACKRAVEIAEHEYMERHGYGYDGIKLAENNGSAHVGSIFEDDEIQSVQINHIMKALNETVNSPVVLFMASLPFTTKLFLYVMVNLIRKTGCQEQPLGDIVDEIKSSVDANGKNKYIVEMQRVLFNQDQELSLEQLRIISWEFLVNQLIEAGIIIRQNLKNERLSAVKFNVSVEDVKCALEQDKIMKTL